MRSPLGVRIAQANEKLEWSEHELTASPAFRTMGVIMSHPAGFRRHRAVKPARGSSVCYQVAVGQQILDNLHTTLAGCVETGQLNDLVGVAPVAENSDNRI